MSGDLEEIDTGMHEGHDINIEGQNKLRSMGSWICLSIV